MSSHESDSMDFESCYWRMVTALEPYWFEQSSMSPETAIAKLVADNEQLRETLIVLVDACGHCRAAGIPPNEQMIENGRAALEQDLRG
jgi:hypothetical protein